VLEREHAMLPEKHALLKKPYGSVVHEGAGLRVR